MENVDVEMFILEMQNRPALWDSSTEEYSNRELKKRCWEEIVNIFGGEGLTAVEKYKIEMTLQRRWKNLRGSFIRELQRQMKISREMQKHGQENQHQKKPGPRYTYFKHLYFLKDVVNIRQPNEEECHDSDDLAEEGSQQRVDADTIKKKRRVDPLTNILVKTITDKDQYQRQMEEDEDRLFLLSLLQSLKSVPKERKLTVKIQFLTVLKEAQEETIVQLE